MRKTILISLLLTVSTAALAQLETKEEYPTGYVTGFYSAINPFQDIDGVLYSVYRYNPSGPTVDDFWTLVKYPANRTETTYSVDPRCTRIAKGAFEGARHLKTIYIPSSVSYIGENAFDGCSALENIFYGSTNGINQHPAPEADNGSKDDVREVARYNLQGIACSPTEKGVQIVVFSDYTTKTVIVE